MLYRVKHDPEGFNLIDVGRECPGITYFELNSAHFAIHAPQDDLVYVDHSGKSVPPKQSDSIFYVVQFEECLPDYTGLFYAL